MTPSSARSVLVDGQLRFLCGDGGTFFRYRVTLDRCRIAPASTAPRKACLSTCQSPVLMCASQARPVLFQTRGKPFSASPPGKGSRPSLTRHRSRLAATPRGVADDGTPRSSHRFQARGSAGKLRGRFLKLHAPRGAHTSGGMTFAGLRMAFGSRAALMRRMTLISASLRE